MKNRISIKSLTMATATMAATTTVETTTTAAMEASASGYATAAVSAGMASAGSREAMTAAAVWPHWAANGATSARVGCSAADPAITAASWIGTAPAVAASTIAFATIAAATAPAMTPSPAVPRSGAYEEAAIKPVWPIKAVWGAGVGIVGVIAPLADRRTVDVGSGDHGGTNTNIRLDILGHCRYRKRRREKHCK